MTRTADFDYPLPEELIAQHPAEPRDSARLMVVHRDTGEIEHRIFRDVVEYLRPGDLLVANDSRVIPARIFGRKSTGGKVEVFLLRKLSPQRWECLVRGHRMRPGVEVVLGEGRVKAVVEEITEGGSRIMRFDRELEPILPELGHVPLPPYIHADLEDPERYQTVYARQDGSVAAPTAGLHFTEDLMRQLREKGVELAFVTLHVGLGTFQPVKEETIEEHRMHSEWGTLPEDVARRINETKKSGGRIVAVGTTSVRTLETGARFAKPGEYVAAWSGETDLFIYPGYEYRVVDVMITNFHLPRSTLLMLVAAFTGKELLDKAYAEAVKRRYRFFSFGDAMLII